MEEENKKVEHDDSDKKKADDLWSAFKADVAVPIKRYVATFIISLSSFWQTVVYTSSHMQ